MPDFDDIVNAVRDRKVVLFLGAGVHYHDTADPSTYPKSDRPLLAGELAAHLASQSQWGTRYDPADYPPKMNFTRATLDYELFIEEDRQAAAQAQTNNSPSQLSPQDARRFRQQGRIRLGTEVDRAVQGATVTSPLIKKLAELGFPIVVTTNYDTHYERTLRLDPNVNPVVRWYHPDKTGKENDYPHGDPSPESPFIFKIHGDISDHSSLIITDEDYIDFVLKMTEGPRTNPVPPTVSFRMSRWPTLFIGYSLVDYNLRLLLKTLHYQKDMPPFKSYAVSKYPDPLITRVWQDEKSAVGFIAEDVWTFIPRLHAAVKGFPPPAPPTPAVPAPMPPSP
jgi:hypothetical protein